MEQQQQIELLRRAARHHESGTTDASTGATKFEASIYVDEDRHEAERSRLLTREPVLMAYSAQLPNPGDYVTHEWTGVPVLVCRQDDGGLKAFLNACRHRGAKVAQLKAGHADKQFVCRYHSWTYDTAGRLRGLPCPTHFAAIDRENCGLLELPVFERAGLVFVTPTRPAGSPRAELSFEGYARELEGFRLHEFEPYASKTVHGKINWKMMIEANQESYHIGFLHRDTAGPRFATHLSLFDTLGPNSRTLLVHKQFSSRALGSDTASWQVLEHGDLVYFLFPSTLILLSTMSAHVLTAYPNGVDKCVVQGTTLVPRGTKETYQRQYYEKYWATILEDISVSEPIQVAARADDRLELWLGANEHLIQHFHSSIQSAIAGELE